MIISKIIKNIFRKIGLEIKRKKYTPYEYLKEKKRYSKLYIKFFGKDFLISDSLSFYFSYKEIFIDNIYKFNATSSNPKIIDLGSNVGTSIMYFKKLYPKSKILGVEADPEIFKILEKNIKSHNFSDVILLNKAISNTSQETIKFYQEGADGGRTHPIDGKSFIEIPTIDLDSLLFENIDLLKIDIEGAETDVLLSTQKLDKVKNIFIEYHSFVNNRQSLDKILNKLSENGFRYIIHSQLAAKRPFVDKLVNMSMDLQLNIFAKKNS